jgi:hypothetical protein
MKEWLKKSLNLYAPEVGKCFWLVGIFFSLFLTMAIFRSYVDTTFLKRFGADAIPEMLLINGGLTILVFSVLNRLNRRYSDAALLSGFLAVCSLLVMILFYAVDADMRLAYPALFQILNLQDSVFLVYLWNMACDFFDARQGKRIFPLIMAAQVLGTAVGSFSVVPLRRIGGYEFLLIITAVAYFLIAVGVMLTARKMMGPVSLRTQGPQNLQKKWSEILAIVREYPIVRYLIVTGLLPNILLPILTYQFGVISQNSFASEAGLMTFLSVFRGSATLVSFLCLFVIGRIYKRIGVPTASLLQPLNFALVFAVLIPCFNIVAAVYGQFSTLFMQRVVAGPVNKVLFNVVPDGLSAWSRVFVRGTVIKVAVIAGALIILLLERILDPREMSVVGVVIAGYLIYESWIFKKKYTEGLHQALMDGELNFDGLTSDFSLNADVTSLIQQSGSLSIFRDEFNWDRLPLMSLTADIALKELLHPDDRMRAEAAAYFVENPDLRAMHRLIDCLDDKDSVREIAIEALAGYGETALPFLEAELMNRSDRIQMGILKAMKYSGLRDVDLMPFIAGLVVDVYSHLAAIASLEAFNDRHSAGMLIQHLQEKNEQILSMIFYGFGISDPKMRFMYRHLRSQKASTSVEMVEASIDRELSKYLIPLIDDIPLTEKIDHGRKMLPIVRIAMPLRVLPGLVRNPDPIIRMLAAYTIGECLPEMRYYSAVECLLADPDPGVVQAAGYAMKRCMKGEAKMPEAIYDIHQIQPEALFEGVGIRGYRAIASSAVQKFFKAGDVLIQAGENVLSVYLLVDGQMGVFDGYGTADQRLRKTLDRGNMIGETWLLSGIPSGETCVVLSDFLETLEFTRAVFLEIMSLYPQVGINLCRQFAVRLSEKSV